MPTTFSVKISTRRWFQRGRSGHRCSSIQRISSRVLASGRPRAASAACSIRSSSACSRRHSDAASGVPTAARSATALTASTWTASSAARSSSVCSARSSSASGGAANRSAAAIAANAAPRSAAPCSAPSPAAARSHCSLTVRRCRRSEMANASIDDSSRCCSPTTSSPAAARARAGIACNRSSRTPRYSSSSRDSTSSGASSGRPSITIRSTSRRGNPPCTARRSSLMRRTITSSRAPRPRTGTPRVKRYGSSSSSRVAKLLEWPLCGVADRNRRCSKRPPRSRTARVNRVSMP